MINKIIKSKYKLFHIINILYYGLAFLLGYCVGVGNDKIIDIFRKIMGVWLFWKKIYI